MSWRSKIHRLLTEDARGIRFGLSRELELTRIALSELAVSTEIRENPRYRDPRHLVHHEHSVYSQGGDDGVLDEILHRIGTENRTIVEFGCAPGYDNNSTYYLQFGWDAIWFECDPERVAGIRSNYAAELRSGQLKLKEAFVTVETINEQFEEMGVPADVDVASIDIDGNDFWVWQALTKFRPRVVIIEYNAVWPAYIDWKIAYQPTHMWAENSYMGASLKALELLGREKGYTLVGCTFAGTNAFFVRDDLVGDHFIGPHTAENFWEPFRKNLIWDTGHPRGYGPSVADGDVRPPLS